MTNSLGSGGMDGFSRQQASKAPLDTSTSPTGVRASENLACAVDQARMRSRTAPRRDAVQQPGLSH